jgi:secondary thiamine-phosphate synthase enzyme
MSCAARSSRTLGSRRIAPASRLAFKPRARKPTPPRRDMAKTSATSTAPNDAPASSPAAGGDGWTQRILTLNPKRRGIFIWTDALRKNVPEIASCKAGVLNLFLRSTTAALSVNENADPDVRTDLENALDRVVPGTDVLDATSRSAFVGVSLDVPVQGGKLALGTWQGLYLCEWGDGAEPCQVVATLVDASDDVRCTRNVTIRAPRRGCHLVQDEVDDAFKPTRNRLKPGAKPGLANLLIRHTSASLTMNENADPTVRGDLEAALNRIVPEEWHHTLFEHVEEGPDDMTAHVKSTLLGCSLTVPVDATGRMKTGTWQGVYLCEHRNVGGMGVGHAREVTTTLIDGAGVANTAGQTTVTLTAPGRGCHDVTAEIAAAAKAIGVGSNVRTGWLNVFMQHTSASLAVCDSTSSGPGDRLERALNETVPESWNDEFFVHTYEGPDDMPGHVKASIVGCSVTVPVVAGELGLGKAQGLFLCEHRDAGGYGCNLNRKVVLTLQGVDK